jgi:hypothetical protein
LIPCQLFTDTVPPASFDMRNKTSVMQHYLFYLAFENQKRRRLHYQRCGAHSKPASCPLAWVRPTCTTTCRRIPYAAQDFDSAALAFAKSGDKTLYDGIQQWRKEPLLVHAKYDCTVRAGPAGGPTRKCTDWVESQESESATERRETEMYLDRNGGLLTRPV